MSHVWTAIAFRAPHALRQSSSQPLLRAIAGHSRHHPIQCQARRFTFAYTSSRDRNCSLGFCALPTSFPSARGCLSKGAWQRNSSSDSKPQQSPESKLQPAQTVASHTDGAVSSPVEELTWRDYDPAGGMPLPHGELNASEIDAIFRPDQVNADVGNYILSVMYWRRASGALIDAGLDFPANSGVSRDAASRGLQYVRSLHPDFDESAAGQEWAKEEEARLQTEIQQRAIQLGIYKAAPDEYQQEEEEPAKGEKQGTEEGRALTSESVLQTVRQAKEAAYEKEQAEKAAAAEHAEISALHSARGPLELQGGVQPGVYSLQHSFLHTGVALHQPPTKVWLQPVERQPWVKYYEEQATIIKDNTVPQLSILRRLGPSFLVLLLTLAGCYYVSENYTPPPQSARLFPDTPPSVATLYALTAVLAASFLLGRLPPLWRFYSKYMTVVPAYPVALGLLGAGLRHDTLTHLASNLLSLWLFGLYLHEDVGRGTFLAIYVASGAAGGFASLAFNVLRRQWATYIFGSSGCVLGVVGAACALRPNGSIRIFNYDVPIAVWVFASLFAAGELVAVARAWSTGIDHAGHLGGIAAGIAAGAYLRQKAAQQAVLVQPITA